MKNKATKYSDALFNVAKQHNIIKKLDNQLTVIKTLYKKEASFRLLFESKRIDEGTKHTIIKNILIGFENVIVEFLCILVTHKQTGHLINIINKFLNLAKKELNAKKIEVITAKQLDKDTISQLFGQLNYKVETTIDTSIIGGMKIKHGNNIFDNSISYQLNQLKKKLHNM